jgi:Bacterial protein of unknown function (DUF899)
VVSQAERRRAETARTGGKATIQHKVGTQEEWQSARDELLAEEKELTRRNDELARKCRELPWVLVEKEYSFETANGAKSLANLFDGRSQLLIYHFMFGPEYAAGCPVCSSIADNLNAQRPHRPAGTDAPPANPTPHRGGRSRLLSRRPARFSAGERKPRPDLRRSRCSGTAPAR